MLHLCFVYHLGDYFSTTLSPAASLHIYNPTFKKTQLHCKNVHYIVLIQTLIEPYTKSQEQMQKL